LTPPRTPTESNGNIPWRVLSIERFADEQRELNAKINEGLWAIRSTMEKGFADLDSRIKVHDERKQIATKVVIGCLTAFAVALVGWLLNISRIVQSAKL
jgi:hypothetical protein